MYYAIIYVLRIKMNIFIISDFKALNWWFSFSTYYCQVYFCTLFQYFAQFANFFLNDFLLYYLYCTCVAWQWTDLLNGQRFLCIEVHRDCSSWQQRSTVWRHKAIWSKGLHGNSCCCINYRLQNMHYVLGPMSRPMQYCAIYSKSLSYIISVVKNLASYT